MHYRYRRRSDDYCPVKIARWQGVLIGWTSFLALSLLDMAVVSAQVFDLRAFQCAVKQAKRAGVDPRKAVAEVRAEQMAGRIGHEVAGRYRIAAWNRDRGGPAPGGAA